MPGRSAKQFEVEGKDREVKTERESGRRREIANLLVLPRPAKSMQNGTVLSKET